ncbi:MAG TPA: hypothetical protein VLL72_07075, partial [Kiloniellales bacterium]|nr:hypothetical protein [Kiloniellales bacterium]
MLLVVLSAIAALVLIGLILISVRLISVQEDLGRLRDSALPRLVKLSQLSQEASASSSIAPALSTNPTPSEFETLLSRIRDKEASQRILIEELAELFLDPNSARILRENGNLLIANLQDLTGVVREQIAVGERLDEYGGSLRRLLASLPERQETT